MTIKEFWKIHKIAVKLTFHSTQNSFLFFFKLAFSQLYTATYHIIGEKENSESAISKKSYPI